MDPSGSIRPGNVRNDRKTANLVSDRDAGGQEGSVSSQRSANHHEGDEAEKTRVARAARIRAARAFAGLDQADFAKALGVSVVTVKRMESGKRETSLDDLHLLADLCGVPREFMAEGFASGSAAQISVADELQEMRESLIQALDTRMDALTEALLTRDEALATSRQAIERLRSRVTHGDAGD
jgi:transcriptional regulator with XRE-family HTH domain